jgi:hypothetical protein
MTDESGRARPIVLVSAPHTHRVVVGGGHQQLVGRMPNDTLDILTMSVTNRQTFKLTRFLIHWNEMSKRDEQQQSENQLTFPNPNSLISTTCGQERARAMKSNAFHFVLMAFQCRDAVQRGGVAEASSAIQIVQVASKLKTTIPTIRILKTRQKKKGEFFWVFFFSTLLPLDAFRRRSKQRDEQCEHECRPMWHTVQIANHLHRQTINSCSCRRRTRPAVFAILDATPRTKQHQHDLEK